MVVMLIVLVGLGTIAGLTVISVQGGSATTNTHRFNAMALYAAESGVAVTMDYLRSNVRYKNPLPPPPPPPAPPPLIPYDPGRFTDWMTVNNTTPAVLPIPGNGVPSGAAGNLLSNDQRGWYEVVLVNNESDDPGMSDGKDWDGRAVIQSTGHGPNGAVAKIEVEIYCVCNLATTDRRLVLLSWRELL